MAEEFVFVVFRDCKIIRDPQTLKSKGYGFVSFTKREVSINYYKSFQRLTNGPVQGLTKRVIPKTIVTVHGSLY